MLQMHDQSFDLLESSALPFATVVSCRCEENCLLRSRISHHSFSFSHPLLHHCLPSHFILSPPSPSPSLPPLSLTTHPPLSCHSFPSLLSLLSLFFLFLFSQYSLLSSLSLISSPPLSPLLSLSLFHPSISSSVILITLFPFPPLLSPSLSIILSLPPFLFSFHSLPSLSPLYSVPLNSRVQLCRSNNPVKYPLSYPTQPTQGSRADDVRLCI